MKGFMIDENTFVMCSEPSPNLTAEMVTKAIEEIKTESELAALYASVSNKARWIEDEVYDYDKGTLEYKQAKEKTDLWFSLTNALQNIIFDILRSEGIEIPQNGIIAVLEPFMKRNGYKDGHGWWIKA